jgi:transposase
MSTGATHLRGDRPGYLSACKRLTGFRPSAQAVKTNMDKETKSVERVIGLDAHPDSFTAAVIGGPTPAAAIVEKVFNKLPLEQLPNWAQKHTTQRDLFVLEASGNSFEIVRKLKALGRAALVLESCHLGKLKEAHANNDKISAVRIGKAYLAGTAKEVWVPDPKTQERRDWFHAHRKAVKRLGQARNSLLSFLSDNGVRLKKGTSLSQPGVGEEQLRKPREWSPRQWQVIEALLMQLRHAEQQRARWRSLLAQEVLDDPELLAIVRLCGVRDVIAFALGAFIGDIKRFASPKKLVKYIGLNPAFDDSGNEEWSGGVGGHGRKDLRSLLVQGAQAILRCSQTDLAKWGKRLLARKGQINLVVIAIARRLTVAVWYLMMGRWTPLEEIDQRLEIKINKILTEVGAKQIEASGKVRQKWKQEIFEKLKRAKVYVLDPHKTFQPRSAAAAP